MTDDDGMRVRVGNHGSSSDEGQLLGLLDLVQLSPEVRRECSREAEWALRYAFDGGSDQRGMNGSSSIWAGCQAPRISTSTGASASICGET